MGQDARDFWLGLQTGVGVYVTSGLPERLLGVRDGFLRYFRDGLGRSVSVSVVSEEGSPASGALELSDERIVAAARRPALEALARLGSTHDFYVGSEEGVVNLEVAGESRWLVRSWTVLLGLGDEAWGSSGAVEIPRGLIPGLEDAPGPARPQMPLAVPGTRRRGGMVGSLTLGLEDRRRIVGQSTLHALASLLYGVVEGRRP